MRTTYVYIRLESVVFLSPLPPGRSLEGQHSYTFMMTQFPAINTTPSECVCAHEHTNALCVNLHICELLRWWSTRNERERDARQKPNFIGARLCVCGCVCAKLANIAAPNNKSFLSYFVRSHVCVATTISCFPPASLPPPLPLVPFRGNYLLLFAPHLWWICTFALHTFFSLRIWLFRTKLKPIAFSIVANDEHLFT